MSEFDRGYFDSNYRDYFRQNPDRKMRFYRGLLSAHLPERGAPRRILEIGCGFGPFLRYLGPGWECFGLDRSEYALQQAQADVPGAGFAVADAAMLPVRGRFDAIAAFDVIEHVADLEAVAQGVRRLLAAEGVFVFVVPVYDGPLGWMVHLLDKDPTHVHKRSRSFWLEWARGNFQVLDTVGIIRYLLPHGPYVHLPSHLFRRVAPAIAVCCRNRAG